VHRITPCVVVCRDCKEADRENETQSNQRNRSKQPKACSRRGPNSMTQGLSIEPRQSYVQMTQH
jgi:hypothetical protein